MLVLVLVLLLVVVLVGAQAASPREAGPRADYDSSTTGRTWQVWVYNVDSTNMIRARGGAQ